MFTHLFEAASHGRLDVAATERGDLPELLRDAETVVKEQCQLALVYHAVRIGHQPEDI